MGKKSRLKNRQERKNRFQVDFSPRPFAHRAEETQLVALRELLPAAYMKVRTTKDYGQREVLVCSLLPGMARALVRDDGMAMVGMQTAVSSGNWAHDLAAALAAVGTTTDQGQIPVDINAPAPTLEQVWGEVSEPLQIRDDVSFWFSEQMLDKPEVVQAIKEAQAEMVPTEAVPGVADAYWVQFNRPFVRWVCGEEENAALDALARLHVAKELTLGEGTKLAGAFRAAGLLIPVWELPAGTTAADLEKPLTEFLERFNKAIEKTEDLTYEERQARAGLINRQVILK